MPPAVVAREDLELERVGRLSQVLNIRLLLVVAALAQLAAMQMVQTATVHLSWEAHLPRFSLLGLCLLEVGVADRMYLAMEVLVVLVEVLREIRWLILVALETRQMFLHLKGTVEAICRTPRQILAAGAVAAHQRLEVMGLEPQVETVAQELHQALVAAA